jgi:serine/threonine protein kinase
MVERDAVQWPKDMSPTFQNFLQGLLIKNPQQRLSWPQLLDHPFVKDFVQGCFQMLMTISRGTRLCFFCTGFCLFSSFVAHFLFSYFSYLNRMSDGVISGLINGLALLLNVSSWDFANSRCETALLQILTYKKPVSYRLRVHC